MEPKERKVHVCQTVEAFTLGGQALGLSRPGVHPYGKARSLSVTRGRTVQFPSRPLLPHLVLAHLPADSLPHLCLMTPVKVFSHSISEWRQLRL